MAAPPCMELVATRNARQKRGTASRSIPRAMACPFERGFLSNGHAMARGMDREAVPRFWRAFRVATSSMQGGAAMKVRGLYEELVTEALSRALGAPGAPLVARVE